MFPVCVHACCAKNVLFRRPGPGPACSAPLHLETACCTPLSSPPLAQARGKPYTPTANESAYACNNSGALPNAFPRQRFRSGRQQFFSPPDRVAVALWPIKGLLLLIGPALQIGLTKPTRMEIPIFLPLSCKYNVHSVVPPVAERCAGRRTE